MTTLRNKDGSEFHQYQQMMVDHIIRTPKCAIWAFMGAGKTAAVLTAVERLHLIDEYKPTLIVAPLRVARDVWPAEIKEWLHLKDLKIVPIIGTKLERQAALETRADIYTINYDNIPWLVETAGGNWPFGMVVLDESTKVKSLRANVRRNADGKEWVQGVGGKRAKELLRVSFKYGTRRLVELSGTPAPNGLQDLWGQAFFLDYGQRLGRTFDAFKTRWFRPSFDGWGYDPLPHAQDQIQNQLKDICLSLKAEDWFDLEKPIVRRVKIQLPPAARKQYREMERKLFTEIQGHQIDALNAGAKTMKCLQIASGAAYLGQPGEPGSREYIEVHKEKLDALEDIIEETAGMPILVAYHFRSDLERILKRFPKARTLDHKSRTLDAWNAGRIPLLLTHPASAGHGLNLQQGSNVLVDFTCGWNSEEHEQILERIGPVRQAQAGFKRNVYRYHIVAENTLDEDVLDVLENKRTVQEALINAMKKRLTTG